MKCPYCEKSVSGFVIRCPHCDKTIINLVKEDSFFITGCSKLNTFIKKYWYYEKSHARSVWKIWDALLFITILIVFVFGDPLSIAKGVYEFLQKNLSILKKEPKLVFYLSVYINTIVSKTISVFLLFLIVKIRRVSFFDEVLPKGEIKGLWRNFIPIYILICVVICIINFRNPLLPGLLFNSVFPEAKLLGNIVLIFSAIIIAPLVEEILFRGFLYPAVNRYLGMYPAIILTSILFVFAHYPQIKQDYLFAINIFVLSFIITYKRAKTGSVILAVILHHIYNLMGVGLGFLKYYLFGY